MATNIGTAYAKWSSSFMQLVYGTDILHFIAIDGDELGHEVQGKCETGTPT